MKEVYRVFIVIVTIIGLGALLFKTCRQMPRTPVIPTPPVHPADTATNCYREPRDLHGYINRKWFWVGLEEGKRSELKCFHIDTTGYSDAAATTGNWIIYNEGTIEMGGPASWSRASYSINEEKTLFRIFDFKKHNSYEIDTLAYEITRLDDDYLILYDQDTGMFQMSHLYMRRR